MDSDTQSLSVNCKQLLAKGHNGFDNSWDCVFVRTDG